jgi:hypothetical protein
LGSKTRLLDKAARLGAATLRRTGGLTLAVHLLVAASGAAGPAPANLAGGEPLSVRVLTPNGGEKLATGTPFSITWEASGGTSGIARIDVAISVNNGSTYSAIPSCTNLGGSTRTCNWSSPGPLSTAARIMVMAWDGAGNTAADISDSKFSIISGASYITVKSPNSAVNWGISSHHQIKWASNIGKTALVTIDKLFLDASNQVVQTETIAAGISNTGVYNWTVSGPVFGRVRIRISWNHAPVSDDSNASFTIADPYISLTAPTAGTVWSANTQQTQKWTTNLGALDQVRVALSTDGGATFPIVLANATATTRSASFTVPNVSTSTARTRVSWTNGPATVNGTSPANFTIGAPVLTVTSPNGGETWGVATTQMVTWTGNLSSSEKVIIDLSLNGGLTYPHVLAASTPSDGKESFAIPLEWQTSSARIRVRWTTSFSVSDMSNADFRIERGLLLTNGSLSVVVNPINGTLHTVRFGGTRYYNAGTPVSDYGFQKDTDTSTYGRNRTSGQTSVPVWISEANGVITVHGIYTKGATSVAFERAYQLVEDRNVLRVTTTFTNLGAATILSYFDTFDPDQGAELNRGRATANDVYALSGIKVGRATDRAGLLTVVMGSPSAATTIAAGFPFWLSTGSEVNAFFANPYDGNGTLVDSGLHVGIRLTLGTNEVEVFTYDQAYGTSPADANAQFNAANPGGSL